MGSPRNQFFLWYADHVCGSRLFKLVWDVGRFGVGRRLFVVPQQQSGGAVTQCRYFCVIPGYTNPQQTSQNGEKSGQSGTSQT